MHSSFCLNLALTDDKRALIRFFSGGISYFFFFFAFCFSLVSVGCRSMLLFFHVLVFSFF
jgi:hypothetical protein